MATPRSTSNSAPNAGTSLTPTTTGLASLATNPASQTLLPLPALVTAVAQSTTSSVERALDQHVIHLLRQQQQLVSAVHQLARPAPGSYVSSLIVIKPTDRTTQQHAAKGSSREHHPSTTDSANGYLEVHPLDNQHTHNHQPIVSPCKQHGGEQQDVSPLTNRGHANPGHRRAARNNSPSGVGIIHTPNPAKVSRTDMEGGVRGNVRATS